RGLGLVLVPAGENRGGAHGGKSHRRLLADADVGPGDDDHLAVHSVSSPVFEGLPQDIRRLPPVALPGGGLSAASTPAATSGPRSVAGSVPIWTRVISSDRTMVTGPLAIC